MRVERSGGAGRSLRHQTNRWWLGTLAIVLCAGLAWVALRWLRPIRPIDLQQETPISSASLRGRLGALRARAALPSVTLDLDLEGHQWLLSPDFATPVGEDPRCVAADAIYAGVSEAVLLCPDQDASLTGETGRPTFELQAEDGAGPVLEVAKSLFSPAGPDAAMAIGYLAELEDLGLPVPAYEVVRLTVNGSDWELYAMEERQPMVALDPEEYVTGTPVLAFRMPPVADAPFTALGSGFARAEAVAGWIVTSTLPAPGGGPSDRVLQQAEVLLGAADSFQAALQGRRAISELVDAASFGRYMALTALWRGSLLPDLRAFSLIYDPVSAKFVPFASGQPHDPTVAVPSQFYGDPEIAKAYVQALHKYGDPTYLHRILADPDVEVHYRALTGEPAGGLREKLAQNQAAMRRVIAPGWTLRAWSRDDGATLELGLEVTEPFPIEVLGLAFGEQGFLPIQGTWVTLPAGWSPPISASGAVLPARLTDIPEITMIRIPRTELVEMAGSDGGELAVVTRIWGLEERVVVPVSERPSYQMMGTP